MTTKPKRATKKTPIVVTTVDENVQAIARSLNLSARHVYKLIKEGVLPRAERGACDPVPFLETYVRYLQVAMSAKASIGSDGAVRSGKDQRTKLLAIQVEREELELARAKSEVMAVGDYVATLSHMVIETKARIKAISPRVAPQLVGESSRVMIQAKIDTAIDEALIDLSKSVPRFQQVTVPTPSEDAPEESTPEQAS